MLCRKREGCPFIAIRSPPKSCATRAAASKTHRNWRLFQTGSDFEIKDVAVQTFAVPHDAVDPVGYMFHHGAAALGYLTDLGFATKLVHERVRAATTLLIETNHDTDCSTPTRSGRGR